MEHFNPSIADPKPHRSSGDSNHSCRHSSQHRHSYISPAGHRWLREGWLDIAQGMESVPAHLPADTEPLQEGVQE